MEATVTCSQVAIVTLVFGSFVGVVGPSSAGADPITLTFNEITNPGKTTVTNSLETDISCGNPPVPEEVKVLGRNATCRMSFFSGEGLLGKDPVLVNFIEDDEEDSVSDTLKAEFKEISEGTRELVVTFISADPATRLAGGTDMQETSGPVNIDISSFGLPLKSITVVNDLDDPDDPPETPEPATFVLLTTGFLALPISFWRKRRLQ